MKLEKKAYLVVFWAVIAAWPLAWLSPVADLEQRSKATFPAHWDSLQNLPASFDRYFNDHFPLRNAYYRLFSNFKTQVLQSSPKPGSALMGRDGWLFYTGENVINNYLGKDTLDAPALAALETNMRDNADWCAQHGIVYLVVICPNTHTVYEEYLPDGIGTPYRPGRTDQVVDRLMGMPGLHLLDLRPVMLSARQNNPDPPIYKKHDSHWSALGAYLAHQQVLQHLPDSMKLPAYVKHGFIVGTATAPLGDLARSLGLDHWRELSYDIRPGFASTVQEDTLAAADLSSASSLRVFKTHDDSLYLNALIFMDSYGIELRHILRHAFHESTFVWDHHFDKDLLLKTKPDIVIHSFVERYLDHMMWKR